MPASARLTALTRLSYADTLVGGNKLIERSPDLKRDLLEFGRRPEFRVDAKRAIDDRLGEARERDVATSGNLADQFVLQYRLPDGGTVVELFVEAHSELPDDERRMLLGWRDVVEGIFEVERRDGEALIVENLLDELHYRVRSNLGSRVFAQMPPRSFLITRLAPVADEWLISGITHTLPASARAVAYKIAVEVSPSMHASAIDGRCQREELYDSHRRDQTLTHLVAAA